MGNDVIYLVLGVLLGGFGSWFISREYFRRAIRLEEMKKVGTGLLTDRPTHKVNHPMTGKIPLMIFVVPISFLIITIFLLLQYKLTEYREIKSISFYWAILIVCIYSCLNFWIAFRHFYRFELLRLISILASSFLTLVIYALTYKYSGVMIGEKLCNIDFITSLYFSVVTFTTLGYGDMAPPEAYRLVAASEAVLGYLYLGILITIISSYNSGSQQKPSGEEYYQ